MNSLSMNCQAVMIHLLVSESKIIWRAKTKNRNCQSSLFNPSILILDEATSALDEITEKNVVTAIEALIPKKT